MSQFDAVSPTNLRRKREPDPKHRRITPEHFANIYSGKAIRHMAAPTGYILGIDLGTSHTVAVVRWPDGRSRPLLVDGTPVMPSAVFVDESGHIHVGRDAYRLAQTDPTRYEPNPKHRVGEHSVLLGNHDLPTVALLAAILRNIAERAIEAVGQLPPAVLTYPAKWGSSRREMLQDAAAKAGFPPVKLVPEPVAAAHYFAEVMRQPIQKGSSVAVFDFGGGTLDVAVLRHEENGTFTVVSDGGLDDLGGLDIDAALIEHVGKQISAQHPETWTRITQPETGADRRNRRLFWDDVRGAKEMLSRTTIAPLPIPGVDSAIHLTRDELERLAGPLLQRGVDETARVIEATGEKAENLAGLFLVGGASRIPLISRLLHSKLGLAPTVLEQPELPVAEGSLAAGFGIDNNDEPQTPPALAPQGGSNSEQVPTEAKAPEPFTPQVPVQPAGQAPIHTPVDGRNRAIDKLEQSPVYSPINVPGTYDSAAEPVTGGGSSYPGQYQQRQADNPETTGYGAGPPNQPRSGGPHDPRSRSVSSPPPSTSSPASGSGETRPWYASKSHWIGIGVIGVAVIVLIAVLSYSPYSQNDFKNQLETVGNTVAIPFENASVVSPVFDDGVAYYAARDSDTAIVTAIDLGTGEKKWQSDEIDCDYYDHLAAERDVLYLRCDDGDEAVISLLSNKDGTEFSEIKIDESDRSVVIGDNLVTFQYDEDIVEGYDDTGEHQWTTPIEDFDLSFGDQVHTWDSRVAPPGDHDFKDTERAYVRDSDGNVAIINTSNGQMVGQQKLGSSDSNYFGYGSTLFVTTMKDTGYTLTAFDFSDGFKQVGSAQVTTDRPEVVYMDACGEERVCVVEKRRDSSTSGFTVFGFGDDALEALWTAPVVSEGEPQMKTPFGVGDTIVVWQETAAGDTQTVLLDADFKQITEPQSGHFRGVDSGSVLRYPFAAAEDNPVGIESETSFVGLGAIDGTVFNLGAALVWEACNATDQFLTCPTDAGYQVWRIRD